MDTPERNQIGTTSFSKFEDSPVFNYINSLSPIKPVKCMHITQTFNSLSFAALPSIFTSPHAVSHKESRFLRRHNHSDSSRPEISDEDGNKNCGNEPIVADLAQLHHNSTALDSFDREVLISDASVEQQSENSEVEIELQQTLKFDCDSPNFGPTGDSVIQENYATELIENSGAIVPYVQEGLEKGSNDDQGNIQRRIPIEQRKEGVGYEWELISDAADLLIFSSPNGSEAIRLIQRPLDPVIGFSTSIMSEFMPNDNNYMQKMQIIDSAGSSEQHDTINNSSLPGEPSELKEVDQIVDNLASENSNKCMNSNSEEKPDNEMPGSQLHRGLRRRCLDFETTGTHRKTLDDGSYSSSSTLSQSDERVAPKNNLLVPLPSSGDASRRTLPGIGLHLNALAKTSNDCKTATCENLPSERQLSLSSSVGPFQSNTTYQESSDREMDPAENGVHLEEDAAQPSPYVLGEEFNQNSPKKKRRRLEHAEESESCKRCNCKKSKCLKLYCECFAAGVYCIEPCSCQDCFNKPIHEDTVLATRKQIESRNPLAFAPKVIRSSDSVVETLDESSKTPASARHKRGCNCKKSSCLKKYCECYQGGVGCSIGCRCEGCKNAFGRKDGIETEQEVQTEASQKSASDKALQGPEVQNNEELNLPITPLQLRRTLVPLPFSRTKLRSFFNIGSSSGLCISQKLERPNIFQSQTQKHMPTVSEDEIPEILHVDRSPGSSIKTSSPNSKRVSPPQHKFGSSPVPRPGRKLILQSIPSFPSLTPRH